MPQACYRELRAYKYELVRPYEQETGIAGYDVSTPFLKLTLTGRLEIRRAYAWNGPVVPAVDTLNFMRASLVHDALYQLIRLRKLPPSCRRRADVLLRDMCRQDGMSALRAWWTHLAVKWCGGLAARPGAGSPEKITCAPKSGAAPAARARSAKG
jgi:Protein of unknown function (DUF1353)